VLTVVAFVDDYSFGILQSGIHWAWFKARRSTLKGNFRYTSDTVFDTFPWPQSPTLAEVKPAAEAARFLPALYRTLDTAVRAAYGMKEKEDPPPFLRRLNLQLAELH
jgi:hypothetical protein